jgi:hypothetical protein
MASSPKARADGAGQGCRARATSWRSPLAPGQGKANVVMVYFDREKTIEMSKRAKTAARRSPTCTAFPTSRRSACGTASRPPDAAGDACCRSRSRRLRGAAAVVDGRRNAGGDPWRGGGHGRQEYLTGFICFAGGNGAARLIVFGAGVKVDTVSRALWRASANSRISSKSRENDAQNPCQRILHDAPLKCEANFTFN